MHCRWGSVQASTGRVGTGSGEADVQYGQQTCQSQLRRTRQTREGENPFTSVIVDQETFIKKKKKEEEYEFNLERGWRGRNRESREAFLCSPRKKGPPMERKPTEDGGNKKDLYVLSTSRAAIRDGAGKP